MINPLQGSALLPNPPVDDATASRLYDKWDTATPEEQDAMRPQLNAWADSKDAEAKAAADKKFEDIFSNFDTMGGHAAAIKNDPIFLQSTSPDETKAGAVNMAYLSHLTGKSMEEIGQNWPDVRAGYAQQFHGKSVQNDRQLYDLIAQEVSQKKVQREAFGNLASDAVVDAFHDIATGTPTDYLSKFAAWKESNQPAIQGIPEAEVQKKYQDLYESTADKIAGIAPQAKAIFDALAAETGRPDAPVGNPGDIQAIASSIQDLPPEQKAALYTVAQIYATRTGQSKGFWTQAAESIGRSITGSVGSIDLAVQQREAQAKLNMLKDGTAVLANAGTPNEVIIPKSGADVVRNDPTAGADSRNFTEITPEKNAELTAQLQEKIKHIVTVRELRSLAGEGIDPIKPSSTWMWHSLEQGLYGAAGSLPLLATSLLQPEIGLPLVGTAIYGQEVDRMALAYPNVPIEHISTMATLSAAPQTLLMNLRAGAILGKLPVLGGYLKTLGNPQMNPIIRMGINMTGQMAEQGAAVMLQSAMPIMVDGIAKAVGEDMPEFDLKQSLQAYAQSTPEALFSVLPFVLIGAGVATHADYRRGQEMTASARGLSEAGFTQAEADRISKIEDPTKRDQEIKATWDNRSPEDIKSGAEMITERIQGDAKMQADPTTPTMRVEDEVVNGQATGNKVFTVLDEQGNQKIQTTDPEAAVHYYEVAMQDAASAQRGHLNSLMEFFKGVDKEQGRERTYTIDTKFDNTKYGYSDDRVTAADEAAAGQSTEQLAERMQQEGVPAGTPLDQVAIKGKTIPDLSRQIYSDTILVLDGRADTMVHERLDGEVMAALHEGRISQEQFLEWCKQTEKATKTPWLPEIPEGGQHSAQQIRETVTKIGEAYLAGRIRKIESIPQGMRGLFKKMLVYFQHVLAKAKVLRAAIDAGKVDANFQTFLAKSVGLPEEAMIDSHTARVTMETVRGVEQSAPETSYMVAPAGKGTRPIRPEDVPNPVKAMEDPFTEIPKETDPKVWKKTWYAWEKENRKAWRQDIQTKDGTIKINGTTADEMNRIAHGENPTLHYLAAANLPELLKNSVLSNVHDDHRGHKDVEEMHRRYAWMDAPDGSRHHVLLTVKRWREGMKLDHDTAYSEEVTIQVDPHPRDLRRLPEESGNLADQQGQGSSDTHAQFVAGIKSEDQHPSNLTETAGNTSYSLTTKAEQERLQAALEKHLNRSPDTRMAVYERMRANLDRVIAKNNSDMLALRDGRDYQATEAEQAAEADRASRIADLHAEEEAEIRSALDANAAKFMGKIEGATPSEKRSINAQAKDRAAIIEKGIRQKYDEKIKAIENEAKIQPPKADGGEKYAQMIQSIGELEAVIKSLPMEIRGKVGGYREILTKSTDAGRTTVLLKRIEMADKALEKLLKDGYLEKIQTTLQNAKPRKGDSGVKKSTLGAVVQEFADKAYEASLLDNDAAVERLESLEKQIAKADDPKKEADLVEAWAITNTFGALAEQSSLRLKAALDYLKKELAGGRTARRAAEQARIDDIREKQGVISEALPGWTDAGLNKVNSPGWWEETKDLARQMVWSHASYEQILRRILPSEAQGIVEEWSDRIRSANGKTEAAALKNWQNLVQAIQKGAGSKGFMKTADALSELGEKREGKVSKLEGRQVELETIPIDKAEQLVRGEMARGEYTKADIKQMEDALIAMPIESRRKHISIYRVIEEGRTESIPMTLDEMIFTTMAWEQADVRVKMENSGWTQESYDQMVKEIASSKVATAFRDYLKDFYRNSTKEINPVYSRMFGMSLPDNPDYAPTSYESRKASGEMSPDGSPTQNTTTPSFAKARVTHNEVFKITPATQIYQQRSSEQAQWVAFAELHREMSAVLNGKNVRLSMKQENGKRLSELMSQVLDNIAKGGGVNTDAAYMKKWLGAATSGTAVASMGYNLKTIFNQFDSVTRFLYAMPLKDVMRAITNPQRVLESVPAAWHSETVQNRVLEGSNPAARFALKQAGMTPNKFLSAWYGVGAAGLKPMQYADGALTSLSSAMVYSDAHAKALKAGLSEKDAEARALDAMDAAIWRFSQPVMFSAKSPVENNAGATMKLLYMFASDARLKTGILIDAVQSIKDGKGSKADHFRRIGVVFLGALLAQTVSNVYRDLFSDDDDDEIWTARGYAKALAIAPFQGFFLLGTAIDVALSSMTGQRAYTNSSNPLVTAGSNAITAAKHSSDILQTDDMEAFYKELGRIARAISLTPVTAVPAAVLNPVKPIVGAKKNIDKER
jgi:hypothetical protein